jgi:tetratricopeptide (TPR) repeat protein
MSPRRLLQIAFTFLLLGLPPASISAGEQSKDYPPQARERYNQGQAFEKKGQWKEAIEAYEDAIRLGMNDYPRVHLYRARANLRRQEFETAIALYTRFIERFGLEDSCRF